MGTCIWLTGPTGAGKSTIARAVVDELERARLTVVLLDEDAVRHLVDGRESIEWLVRMLTDGGMTTVVAADLPSRDDRERVRASVSDFIEVFVDGGALASGADDGYEEPFAAELRVPTHDREPAASIALVLSWLEHRGHAPIDE